MNFGVALALVRNGGRVRRAGWGMWLGYQAPDEHSKMTLPYLYLSTTSGDLVPWQASQSDLLAEDWQEVFAALPLNAAVA
jgi:hypothetical protein